MKTLKKLFPLFVVLLTAVGCGNANSDKLSIYKVTEDSDITKIVELIGEPSTKEEYKYTWDDYEIIKDFPGELEILFDTAPDVKGRVYEIRWTPNEVNRDKFNKLADSLKKVFKDSWREFNDGYTYKFYYNQDTDDPYAVHLLSTDDAMMLWTPIIDTIPE